MIGYPSTNQVKEADYIGVDSGYDTDKLANVGYTVAEDQTVHAPVIDQMKLLLFTVLLPAFGFPAASQLSRRYRA